MRLTFLTLSGYETESGGQTEIDAVAEVNDHEVARRRPVLGMRTFGL